MVLINLCRGWCCDENVMMNDIKKSDIEILCHAAHDASINAYAPYSRYHVGAALLLDDGEIITGSNFENASYGMTLCAETVAIASANSRAKLKNIIAIAVAGGMPDANGKAILTQDAITPCGRCRQIIKEVADVSAIDTPIYCLHDSGYKAYKLSQILPDAFGPKNLT